MESKIVVGNMKMYLTYDKVMEYLNIANTKINSKNVIICPTSLYTPYFLNHNYQIGVQNIHYESLGAYTGEISASQATSMGINYTLIGHSERRQYFGETNEIVNKKIVEALKNNVKIILCIGETLLERESNATKEVLKNQITGALANINSIDNIIIAYEPIWAIGTNITPTNNEIEESVSYIKDLVNKLYNGANINVLYGGSINAKNIEELNKIPNLNGYLVGGASTKIEEFLKIIEVVVTQ